MTTFVRKSYYLFVKRKDVPFCIACHKGCDDGHFGTECNQVCGWCKNTTDCHHVNGTCLTGCESGYIDDMCKIRKYVKPCEVFTSITYYGCMLKQ